MNNKILIVNEYEIIRAGLKHMLLSFSGTPCFEITEARSIAEAKSKCNGNPPDVMLVGFEIAVFEGKDLVCEQNGQVISLPIIAVTDHYQGDVIAHSPIVKNIKGVLPNSVELDELIYAIKQVMKGDVYFHNAVRLNKGSGILKYIVQELKITKREQEILSLIFNNFSTREISDQLFLSERTVETHRYNLIRKLKDANLQFALKGIRA